MKGINLYKVKLFNQISLSDCCKSIILGCILGDGSLIKKKEYKNVYLSIKHSNVQKDYLLWKIEKFADTPIGAGRAPYGGEKWTYLSRPHEELSKLYNLTYKHNKLVIKRSWLNNMTPLSLAVWWLDKGSLISNKKKGVINTDDFDEKSAILLSRYLLKVWDIKTKVSNVKSIRNGKEKLKPRIWMSTNELNKFISIIKEYVPESMKYKIEMK